MSSAAAQRLPIQLSQAQTSPEAVLVQARPSHRRTEAEIKPRWIWRVVQWKYTVDVTSRQLKRAYFHYVFLPFNRFSYWAFDLLPPNGRDDTGRLCWTEDQGYFDTEWEAEQEAARYPLGHAVRVPLRASLPAETVNTEQYHPNAPREVRQMYREKAVDPTTQVFKLDLVKLAAKVSASDHMVEQYRAKAT